MAKFSVAPTKGLLMAVIRAFSYLKKNNKSKIVIDPELKEWNYMGRFYPNINGEMFPLNMAEPSGESVQINMFCDVTHATDLMTRRLTTGFIFLSMVHQSPGIQNIRIPLKVQYLDQNL
jgi:hypothetical protein